MVDYNIEFSHIYSNEKFGEEQEKSIEILKNKIAEFLGKGKTYSICVLIDEYNSKENILTEDSLLSELSRRDVAPSFVSLESNLVSKKDFLLEHILNEKLRKKYEKYINKNDHAPCPFLVAIWYLYRLSYLNLDKEKNDIDKFKAKKIVNILDKKYEDSEKKAIEIIKSTDFSNCIKDIKTTFY